MIKLYHKVMTKYTFMYVYLRGEKICFGQDIPVGKNDKQADHYRASAERGSKKNFNALEVFSHSLAFLMLEMNTSDVLHHKDWFMVSDKIIHSERQGSKASLFIPTFAK